MGGKEGEFVGEGRKELGGWREVVEGGRCQIPPLVCALGPNRPYYVQY